jgi:N-acetylglucosamine-6-phosphate deacetylase
MALTALLGARIFDGARWHEKCAVLHENGVVRGIVAADAIPSHASTENLDGGILTPGFIDLQVNGGGGVMLNDAPAAATMGRIAAAHRKFGTTALLPTLITADAPTTQAAIDAAIEAAGKQPGVIGLHLEGPHLAPARKGAHRAELMRPMTQADAEALAAARERIGALMVTVAVEQVSPALIRLLADAGVIVSIGHSDTGYDAARAAFDAGARAVTHLFNAMSQLGNREPGLVGAALAASDVWCGLIADGFHVHVEAMRIALAAKRVPGSIFLVTDAMATVGSNIRLFMLGEREVRRGDGRLTLADGTLAGADVDMACCVRFAANTLGLGVEEALRMASLYPAQLLRDDTRGRIGARARADFVWLDEELSARRVWLADEPG